MGAKGGGFDALNRRIARHRNLVEGGPSIDSCGWAVTLQSGLSALIAIGGRYWRAALAAVSERVRPTRAVIEARTHRFTRRTREGRAAAHAVELSDGAR